MKTLGKRILLSAVKAKQTDIIRPADVDYYEVKYVGSQVEEVKVGDKVFYQQGVKMHINGDDYILIDEDDVVVIL